MVAWRELGAGWGFKQELLDFYLVYFGLWYLGPALNELCVTHC